MSGMIQGAAGMMMHGSVWSVADTNPDVWFRADLGHAVADGAPMPAITDQGSAGLDISQGTGTGQFTYDEVNAAFNGQATMSLDGGDRLSSVVTAALELADGGDITIACVLSTNIAAQRVYYVTHSHQDGGLFAAMRPGGAHLSYAKDNEAVTITAAGVAQTVGQVYALAQVLEGGTGPTVDTLESWQDGVLSNSTTGNLGPIRPSGGTGTREFVLGSWRTSSGSFDGDIAEFVIWLRHLTPAEDASLATSWASRYGLTLPGVTQ